MLEHLTSRGHGIFGILTQLRMPCLHSSVVSPVIVPGLQRLKSGGKKQFNQDRGHEYTNLGGGFKTISLFSPGKLGKMNPF